jgi:hypothetical protein
MDIQNISQLLSQIQEAFDWAHEDIELKFRDTGDIDYGRFLIEQADGLVALEQALGSIEVKYDQIRESIGLVEREFVPTQSKGGLRKFRVEITEGAINQSLLSLTAAKKQGLVEVGERMTIHTPVGKAFKTRIGKVGNRLEERGRIKAFYNECKVEENDVVVFEEIEPKVW